MKNIKNFVEEVKVNGYKKIPDFLTSDEAKEIEALTLEAFNLAEESQYHINE